MGVILFNDKLSTDFHMEVESRPDAVFPSRRGEPYQIAGRNGSEVREEDTFDNYTQPYKVWLGGRRAALGARALSRGVAEWLLGSSDYCRLEHSYEPEYFRLARFAGPLNVEQVLRNFGRCTLEFDCQPQRFLKAGENAVTVFKNVNLATLDPSYKSATITNPTSFSSLPLLKITGSGTVDIAVESKDKYMNIRVLLTSDLSDTDTIYIDCNSYKMYEETFGANWSRYVEFVGSRDLAVLAPGTNMVVISGMGIDASKRGLIQKVDFIPRWWTI